MKRPDRAPGQIRDDIVRGLRAGETVAVDLSSMLFAFPLDDDDVSVSALQRAVAAFCVEHACDLVVARGLFEFHPCANCAEKGNAVA